MLKFKLKASLNLTKIKNLNKETCLSTLRPDPYPPENCHLNVKKLPSSGPAINNNHASL